MSLSPRPQVGTPPSPFPSPGFSYIFSAPTPSSLAAPSSLVTPLLPDDRKEFIKTNV